MKLVLGHLKTLIHSSFSLLLYFCKCCTKLFEGIKSSSFLLASLLLQVSYISGFSLLFNPGLSGARLEPRTTWCLVAVFRGLIFSSCLCWLYNNLDALTNIHVHTSSLLPTCWTWTYFLLACHPCNLHGTSPGEQPTSCFL